jgi:long-subunit fatty acid transport protein
MLTTTMAGAGGLDRSGQGIGVIFESGNYAELSFGAVMPDVTGVFGAATPSGNVITDYTQLAGAVKWDINDNLSFAVIADQPFGASVYYENPTYPLGVSRAELVGTGLTALARYKISERISVHGGARAVRMSGNVNLGNGAYVADFADDTDVGYVLGGAYEIPDIALRVALTYSSETSFSNDTVLFGAVPVAPTVYTMPKSVNLDFQTGVAANTLVFGSIRWADWTSTSISSFGYPSNPLVDYTSDVYTYTLGVGRKFSDKFSGSIGMSYESAEGIPVSNLSPTDGYLSVQIGGSYAVTDAVKISGGLRYVMIGDAVTETIGAVFNDNSAVAAGIKVGFSF